MADVDTWSPLDESNTSPPPDGWPEFMLPSGVNNSARAMMGAIRRWYDKTLSGELVLPYLKLTGGTVSGAVTVSGAMNTASISSSSTIYAASTISTGGGISASGTINGAGISTTGNASVAGTLTAGGLSAPAIVFSGSPHPGHGFMFDWDGTHMQMYVDNSYVGPIGHIDSVSAGNGLTGGGSTGAVSLAMSGSYSGSFSASVNIIAGSTVQGGYVHSTGNVAADGSVTCNGNVVASGQVQASSGQMYMGDGGAGRIMQMASGWYWEWNSSNGDLIWGGPSGASFWVTRYSDRLCGNQIGAVFGFGAYINASDRRLKQDIEPATHGLDTILGLSPVTFRRKPQEGTPPPRLEIGFVAQDVKTVFPEAVVDVELGDDPEPTLGITDGAIVAALVNAVKALESRLTAGGL
jgi:hypothetical protein